jgi:hypothetical protein
MAPKWRPATAGASSTSCVPHRNSGPSRCPIGRKSFTLQTSHSSLLGSPSGPAASSLKQVRQRQPRSPSPLAPDLESWVPSPPHLHLLTCCAHRLQSPMLIASGFNSLRRYWFRLLFSFGRSHHRICRPTSFLRVPSRARSHRKVSVHGHHFLLIAVPSYPPSFPREEFARHGMSMVTLSHRNVCQQGFGDLVDIADAGQWLSLISLVWPFADTPVSLP